MPKESTGTHTPGSIARIASQMQEIAAQIRATAELMETEPTLIHVEVLHESSLNVGLERIQRWADSYRSSVREAKLLALRNRVSDGAGKDGKQRKKTP